MDIKINTYYEIGKGAFQIEYDDINLKLKDAAGNCQSFQIEKKYLPDILYTLSKIADYHIVRPELYLRDMKEKNDKIEELTQGNTYNYNRFLEKCNENLRLKKQVKYWKGRAKNDTTK